MTTPPTPPTGPSADDLARQRTSTIRWTAAGVVIVLIAAGAYLFWQKRSDQAAAYCTAVADTRATFTPSTVRKFDTVPLAIDGASPTTSTTDAVAAKLAEKDAMAASMDAVRKRSEAAPPEIAGPWATVVSVARTPSPSTYDKQAGVAAFKEIDAYTRAHCGSSDMGS